MQEEITIEKAEKFFLNGETRSAGNIAGVLFEQSVQKLCTFHQIPLSNGLRTRDLLDSLHDASIISREKHRELQMLVSIRNKCAHATPVTRTEVQTLIRGTKKFIHWVDSQSSTASARPFSTQPPPVRKQLVCPVCGKDSRVRKVSGITRNSLLEFPTFPSRSKRERMSNSEHFYYVFGWLIVIFSFVIFCPLSFAPLQNVSTLVGLLIVLGMFVGGLFMIIVPRRMATAKLQEDRLKALAIWDTLYYCDRDDALYSSERPGYYVSAANMRKILGY